MSREVPALRWLVDRAADDVGLDVQQRIALGEAFDRRVRAAAFAWTETTGQRKAWDGTPDLCPDGWIPYGWERHDYHETITWIRPASSHHEPDPPTGVGPLPPGTIIRRPVRR